MANSNKQVLRKYRKAISDAWLPLVGRDRLTSSEYSLIASWFTDGLEAALILKAIRQVAERGATIYSLGVIRADLVRLQREQAHTQVGAHKASEPDWKAQWLDCLPEIIEGEPNERRAALLQRLLDDLSGLTPDQAQARYREAMQAL